jgi:hypothetical protein
MTYCPRCRGESGGIILVGADDGVYECSCGITMFGRGKSGLCGACGEKLGARARTLKQGERLPGPMCEKCEKEEAEHAKIVAEGGIYWRCKDCKRFGVIKPNEYTAGFREATKKPTPEPVGVNFDASNCPVCGQGQPMPDGVPPTTPEAPAP